MNEEILPLGTIVTLNDSEQPLMIVARMPLTNNLEDETVYYDYGAVLIPQGLVSSDEVLMFNSGQISKVGFRGFIDAVEQDFEKTIPEMKKNTDFKRGSDTGINLGNKDKSTSIVESDISAGPFGF